MFYDATILDSDLPQELRVILSINFVSIGSIRDKFLSSRYVEAYKKHSTRELHLSTSISPIHQYQNLNLSIREEIIPICPLLIMTLPQHTHQDNPLPFHTESY